LGHLGAGGGQLVQELVLLGLEVVGSGQQHPGEPARGDVAAVGVRAALVDVLVQEVEAARERGTCPVTPARSASSRAPACPTPPNYGH
jgi:hypothetical protein